MLSRPILVIATTNAGKYREFSALLADVAVRLSSLADHPGAPAVAETGATYEDNAIAKAIAIARWNQSAALADDSGLEVDALGGAPGVRSARYAGCEQDSNANIAKLLAGLRDLPPERRTAQFRCVIAVACADGSVLTAAGSCAGLIIDRPRGRGGFGYDPVFLVPRFGRTFAEIAPAVKNRISHRAQACAALRRELPDFLAAHAPPT